MSLHFSAQRLLAGFICLCFFVQGCLACAWDRDTVGDEAERFPQVADAIMGRLKIMPKSFYGARIQILLKKNAEYTLGELDDLTVAYDKLGDFEKALRYSNEKRKQLNKSNDSDNEYRYWANLGTIKAHEALRKRDSVNQDLLDSGIKHLERAVEINRNAHFGREMVQIEILKLIRSKLKDPELKLTSEQDQKWRDFVKKQTPEKVQKGILGMMAFGSGPDSFELLSLLATTLSSNEGQLRSMIEKRLTEIIGARRPYFEIDVSGYTPQNEQQFRADYAILKKDAENYRELVEAYVDTKLNQGKHPDTDPSFWKDWKEVPRPNLVKTRELQPSKGGIMLIGGFLLFIVILPWIAMLIIGKKLKQKQIEP
jgi:tetratricopeptide (TPR) repeat protein